MSSGLIEPHGGKLIECLASESERAALREKAKSLPKIELDERSENDVDMLSFGGFSPLKGFMDRREYESVVDVMRLADGTPWPIPITLMVSEAKAEEVKKAGEAALVTSDGTVRAILSVEETFRPDKDHECEKVYRTKDPAHPAVAYIKQSGPIYVGGKVKVIEPAAEPFPGYAYTPAQTRAEFEKRKWKTVVAFQTRNPIHRAHEYLTKCAMENTDGLLIHPIVGATKGDDIPADVRMRCYEVLIKNYYPHARVALAVLPAAMRYGGPREAILHAIYRKNYGCTHFIVGRDHAGVGNYYGTYDAQVIFDEFKPGELGIEILKYEHAFYCKKTQGMASDKTAPEGSERVFLSGTKVREMLVSGQYPPVEFTRPEVAAILVESYKKSA